MSKILGSVQTLWRYPVKSMLGESCNSLAINRRGVVGDRLFAIRNRQGKFGSGKNTCRFRHIDGLLALQSFYQKNLPVIEFPNGQIMRGDEANIHTVLSQTLGQPVTLAKENRISHFDDSPIHIITTASLKWLKKALPNSQIDENRFRANLILDVVGDTLVEHQWVGKQIQVGEVKLKITKLCERCVMTSSPQKNLPQDPQIFQHIMRQSNSMFGVYARVVDSGVVSLNDEVKVCI